MVVNGEIPRVPTIVLIGAANAANTASGVNKKFVTRAVKYTPNKATLVEAPAIYGATESANHVPIFKYPPTEPMDKQAATKMAME